MRKFALLGASALVLALALGVASASAEPFNPVTGYDGSAISNGYGAPSEGRAAAIDNSAATTSSILEQFHEGK